MALGRIGPLTKLAGGGQGIVYSAPAQSTVFAKSMVFKQYKSATLASLNVAGLEAMPAFLESLQYMEGARLIAQAAWPCAIVENEGNAVGFLMPAIPDDFYIDLCTVKGFSRVAAEFQHLLNEPQVLSMLMPSETIDSRQRYTLLKRAASALSFFHGHQLCVGDISPKNLLFSLRPTAVYFIDCDAMRLKGISLTDQVETPGWEVPSGEEKATVFSDRFKLGLLALRLLAHRQDSRDPALLPLSTPTELRKIITDTLSARSPAQRPTLSQWISALDSAIVASPANSLGPPPRSQSAKTPPAPTPRHAPIPPLSTPVPPSVPVSSAKGAKGWLVMSLTAVTLGGLLLWAADYSRKIDSPPVANTSPSTDRPIAPPAPQTVIRTATETATETVTLSPFPSRASQSSARPTVPPLATPLPIIPPPPRESSQWLWVGIISGTCDEGGSCGVQQRQAPYTKSPRLYSADLVDDTEVSISCWSEGDLRSNRARAPSETWYRLLNGAYVPSVYVLISARSQVSPELMPEC